MAKVKSDSKHSPSVKKMLDKVKRSIAESRERNKIQEEKYKKELADYEALYGKYED